MLSNTAIAAQIGLLSPGGWFGEEAVILGAPVIYSVTARSHCTLLVMKSSSFSNLPSEILAAMAEKTRLKAVWLTRRLKQLTEITTGLLNEDMGNRIYQKSVKKLEKEFPQANPSAIQNLGRLILKNEPKLTPSIFQKLGYVRGRMCNSTLKTCISAYNIEDKKNSDSELSFFKKKRVSPAIEPLKAIDPKKGTTKFKRNFKVMFATVNKDSPIKRVSILPEINKHS